MLTRFRRIVRRRSSIATLLVYGVACISLTTLILVGLWLVSQPPTPSSGNHAGQPKPEQAEPSQPKTEPAQQGTTDNPLVVSAVRSEAQAAEDRQDRENERANRRYSLWLSMVTLVVLGFQVWLLVNQNTIIDKQTTVMRRQRAEAATHSKYMDEGLVVTRQALTLSERTAKQAEEASLRAEFATKDAERAYLAIQPDEITIIAAEGSPVPGYKWQVTYKLRNYGRTPAFIERFITKAIDLPMPKDGPLLPVDPKRFWAGSKDDIGIDRIEAGNYITHSFDCGVMSQTRMNEWRRKDMFFCVAIRVRYRDVFGRREQYGLAVGYAVEYNVFSVIPEDRYTYNKEYRESANEKGE